MLDFIVLGLIPGTNISIGFYIYLALLIVGASFAIRTIRTHKHHKLEEQEKTDKINRLAI